MRPSTVARLSLAGKRSHEEQQGCSVCGGGLAHPDARWCMEHAPHFLAAGPARLPPAEVEERAWSHGEGDPPPVSRGFYIAIREISDGCDRILARLGAPSAQTDLRRGITAQCNERVARNRAWKARQ